MMGRHVNKMWEAKRPKPKDNQPVIQAGAIQVAALGAKKLRKVV
jgi:hypothetical protein